MSKVTFSKLGLKSKNEIKTITINEQDIEIKQYLPINEKLDLISNVINKSLAEDASFFNPVKVDVIGTLEIIYAYTNINFTDKQKEDPAKLYDLLENAEDGNIINEIIAAIPQVEYQVIIAGIDRSIGSYYQYKNSIMGVLEAVSADYSNLNFETEEMEKRISNPDNLNLLKDIMTKLG